MPKNRQRRATRNRVEAHGQSNTRPPETRRAGASRSIGQAGRRNQPSPLRHVATLAILPVLALVGVVAWWLLPFGGEDGGAGSGSVQPIATLNTPDIHSLLIDPNDPDHVLFGSHVGIMESRDGGFTWESGSLRGVDAMSMAVSPKDTATLYVAGHDVFQVSRDGGGTWQPLAHDLPGTDIHAFAQDAAEPARLFAYLAGDRIYASADGGATWASLPSQPSGPPLSLASNGAALFAATPNGIEASRDGGGTWTGLPSQPSAGASSLAAPGTDAQLVYAGTPSGLSKSSDGGVTWQYLGPEGLPVAAMAVDPSDPARVLFVTPTGGVYGTDDSGESWLAPK